MFTPTTFLLPFQTVYFFFFSFFFFWDFEFTPKKNTTGSCSKVYLENKKIKQKQIKANGGCCMKRNEKKKEASNEEKEKGKDFGKQDKPKTKSELTKSKTQKHKQDSSNI
jgi:hypothetical protein